MNPSGNYVPYNRNYQRYELQGRRLRLISDIMEDYQENMRRAFRLIGCELGISNHVFPNTRNVSNLNVDDWLDRVSHITTDMYSPESQEYERRGLHEEELPYSYTPPTPPTLNRSNVRRGFIYTQLLEPRTDQPTDTGITNEQIANATHLIQYDASMNETRCPITWDQFEPGQNILQINNCRHIFGHQPLMEWFQRHSRCPVCRASVLPTQSQQTNNTTNTTDESTLSQPDPSGNSINNRSTTHTTSSSRAINQILSGILTSVNGAVNTESGYYESEFAFNMNDLLDAYTQLVRPNASSSQNPER